jgi:hypothetical protein
MAAQDVTAWLQEKKPGAVVHYHGPDQDGVYWWRLEIETDGEEGSPFRLGVPEEVLNSAGMLAERLMELENQGYLDQAGEEEHVVYLNPIEVAREPGSWE